MVKPLGLMFWPDGHMSVGGVVSVTTTLNVGQDAWLPALSVALHVTGVGGPTRNADPDAGVHADDSKPEPSVAENGQVASAAGEMPSVGVVCSENVALYGGQASVGGVTSTLLMLNMHVATLPALSVAWHVTVVLPSGTVAGLDGEHDVAFRMPELSVAVGTVNMAFALVDTPPVGVTCKVDGHVNDGDALSAMVSGNEQVVVRFALSVAVHDTVVVDSTK